MKHSCYMNYEIEVEFSDVTSKELGEILALDLGEMKEELSYGDFIIPKIDRMYDSWRVVYNIDSCGRIHEESLKYYDQDTFGEKIYLAERVAEYVRSKLNLTEEES